MKVLLRLLVLLALAAPVSAQDQIDFSSAVMGSRESPDIRSWPVMASITRVHFDARESYERGNVGVEFAGRDALQPGYGNQGPIAWSLWFGFRVGGVWVFAPMVECVRDYIPTGFLFDPNHVGSNLLYFADALDARIARYQPKLGEQIAIVATTGDTRRQNAQPAGIPPKRTNVVLVPFAVGDYGFQGGVVPPAPTTPPVTTPVQPVNVTGLQQQLDDLGALVAELGNQVGAFSSAHAGLSRTVAEQADVINAIAARVVALEGKPVPVRCVASANVLIGRVPISCRLE